MTPDQALEAAAVMIAFANGRKIEWKYADREDYGWRTSDQPTWDWIDCEYRVAPEPWQLKIWVHDEDTRVFAEEGDGFKPLAKGWRLITVKEVLP